MLVPASVNALAFKFWCLGWHCCLRIDANTHICLHSSGDKEEQLGLLVAPFMQRATADMAHAQQGFIEFLCKPLFEALADYLPDTSIMLDCLKGNTDKYFIAFLNMSYRQDAV